MLVAIAIYLKFTNGKYLENHNLSKYKDFFHAKIITNRNRTIIKDMTFIDDNISEDYSSFYRFTDQIIPQIDKYYRNENFYDCLLKYYIKKASLCDSKREFDEISNKIYKLFEEFETFKGAKLCGKINVFEDESDDEIKWHTKNFYKSLLDFYATKTHNIHKAFEIGEYVVWTLNMDMNPGFYSELAVTYINLISKYKDINGEELSLGKEQEYFQKIAELDEKINENSVFPPEDCDKINSFKNLYEDLIEFYHDREKFGIIITAFRDLLKDNKNTTCIINKAVNTYIAGRGKSNDHLDLDGIIENIGNDEKNYRKNYDKNIKEFYEKIALCYAHEGLFKRASSCCEIAMCNRYLSDKNKLYFRNLREDFLA